MLAVMDGTVHALSCANSAGGPDVSSMFAWNSLVLLSVNGVTWVEYVHLRANSARVNVGEAVSTGQPLAESGQVGFCPTPHLHLEAHRGDVSDNRAPSIAIRFSRRRRSRSDREAYEPMEPTAYEPIAGRWYEAARGEVCGALGALGLAEGVSARERESLGSPPNLTMSGNRHGGGDRVGADDADSAQAADGEVDANLDEDGDGETSAVTSCGSSGSSGWETVSD